MNGRRVELAEAVDHVRRWRAGDVVLYWAQAVLVPIALAILLSFVLAPPVNWLERWLGRVPAVLMVW